MLKKFRARVNLGFWMMMVHLGMGRRRGKRARERFLSRYFPMGFLPVTESEVSNRPLWASCIGCGYCLISCECRSDGDGLPRRMILAEGKHPELSESFNMNQLGCTRRSQCAVECPVRIQPHSMASQILSWRRMRGIS